MGKLSVLRYLHHAVCALHHSLRALYHAVRALCSCCDAEQGQEGKIGAQQGTGWASGSCFGKERLLWPAVLE
jgi:hypothetical protein